MGKSNTFELNIIPNFRFGYWSWNIEHLNNMNSVHKIFSMINEEIYDYDAELSHITINYNVRTPFRYSLYNDLKRNREIISDIINSIDERYPGVFKVFGIYTLMYTQYENKKLIVGDDIPLDELFKLFPEDWFDYYVIENFTRVCDSDWFKNNPNTVKQVCSTNTKFKNNPELLKQYNTKYGIDIHGSLGLKYIQEHYELACLPVFKEIYK